ncbi:hypothetical protein [Oceanobacillus massiliensis]|uniref:hypothetical protein n=1 Tax=Oceanobacillus massiliensis TaxID=1465765 RepID=UPI003015ADE0
MEKTGLYNREHAKNGTAYCTEGACPGSAPPIGRGITEQPPKSHNRNRKLPMYLCSG